MISQLFMGLNQFEVKKCRKVLDLLGAVSVGKVYHSIENRNKKRQLPIAGKCLKGFKKFLW